jgi:WD40 repeat protein
VAGLGATVAALILFVAITGPLVALNQSRLRRLAEDRANDARVAQARAQAAQKAEEDRRLEAVKAGHEATTQALAANKTLVRSYLSQAQNLRHLAQLGRQSRALELLKLASGLRRATDGLAAELGDDPAGLRAAMAQFWREQQPRLRSEAATWLTESSLKPVFDRRFPALPRSPSGENNVMTSRSSLVSSDDGKWLAYFRVGLDGTDPTPTKFVEIIEADTGKTGRSLKVGPLPSDGFSSMNALAFDSRDEDVLLAQKERALAYLIQRWSRSSGKVKGTVRLSFASSQDFPTQWDARLVFSADRRSLLSIPAEGDKRATVWDLATSKLLRAFEKDFAAEGFFPDGRRIVGTTGSEVIVRDVATGGVTKRWPMPDGLVSVLGNLRSHKLEVPFQRQFQPEVQSLWVSPDGKWVAAFGQHPRADFPVHVLEMPTRVFLFDAESGQVRARIPIPDVPADNPIASPTHGPAPRLAFDAGSHWLAVATHQSLSLFAIPEGTPLVTQALPESGKAPPRQSPLAVIYPSFAMPSGLLFAHGASRLFSSEYPWDTSPLPANTDPRTAARLIEQVIRCWDVTLPRTTIEDHPHDGPIRAVTLEPRNRFMVAAGDDRTIRLWDRGRGHRWSVGYPGEGSLFPYIVSKPGEASSWRGGSFDQAGALFLTRLPDRTDVWDATSGERRGSFATVIATSPNKRYLVVPGGEGPPPAHELRIIDVSRNALVLSIPGEQDRALVQSIRQEREFPRVRFSPDSRFLVVGGNGAPGSGNSTLLIADVAEARVVARLKIADAAESSDPVQIFYNGSEWAIGPAGKVLVVSVWGVGKLALHAYELATGRQIGEFTRPLPALLPAGVLLPMVLGDHSELVDHSGLIAPDDRRMAVPILTGAITELSQGSSCGRNVK